MRSIVLQCRLLSIGPVLLVLIGLTCGSSIIGADSTLQDSNSKPDFRATQGLWDTSKPSSLGLDLIDAEHSWLYQAASDIHKFCHHPNLIVFHNELYCMWSNGILGEDEPGQRVLYAHSSDGTEWTTPAVLTDHLNGKGICVAAGFLVNSGELVAYYTTTGGSNFHADTSLRARVSRDGSMWSESRYVTGGFFIEAPRRLAGGRLVLAGEHVGNARETKRMRFMFSDDPRGLSGWHEANIPPPELKTFGYTEPSFFMHRAGTLSATLRNYSGFLYATTSKDDGQTWTAPVRTNFRDSTARSSAGNLPDGTAYIINNPMPRQFDRSLLAVTLSRNGDVFDRSILIRKAATKRRFDGKSKLDGWQYPNALVWKGSLFVAYSVNKEDVAVTRVSLSDLKL